MYVNLADLVIDSLTEQMTANTENINKLDKTVNDMKSSNNESINNIETQLNNIRQLLRSK